MDSNIIILVTLASNYAVFACPKIREARNTFISAVEGVFSRRC